MVCPFTIYLLPGKMDIKFSYEEARDYIVNNFRSFSNKLADFAGNAFRNGLMQNPEKVRPGRLLFQYSCNQRSRILSNFTGTFSDITTLAHELGHAYHGLCRERITLIAIILCL